MRAALLFPGEGAYDPRVVTAFANTFPEVTEVYAEVDRGAQTGGAGPVSPLLLGSSPPTIESLLADAPDALQLSIFALSVAAYRVLFLRGARPSVLIGHSLGEIAALAAAGAFSVEAAAEVVAHRCAALGEHRSTGTMMALACDATRAEAILALFDGTPLVIAAENSPVQTIISGPAPAVEEAGAVARALRVEAVTLKAPYPFHNPLLEKAAAAFATRLESVPRSRPTLPVYSPILGRYYEPSDDPCRLLPFQLVHRVRFAQAVRQLRAGGVDVFVEAGVGSTLVKLVGRTLGQAVAVPALGAASAVRVSMSEAAELLSSDEASPVTPVAAPRPAPAVSLNTMPPSQLIDWAPPTPPNVAASLGRGAVGFPQVRATNDDLGAGPKSRAELFNELRAFYAEALEYPPEVFSEEVTLEADLGVDSVKQTELFARTVERYQLTMPTDDMQLSDYDTMGKVVEMIWSLLPSQTGASGIGAVV